MYVVEYNKKKESIDNDRKRFNIIEKSEIIKSVFF